MKLIYLMTIFGCLSIKSINGQGTPPPDNFLAVPLATSISLTWTYPQDVTVDEFEISYNYTIDECSADGEMITPMTVLFINGTARSYTITRSSTTPVEEDSEYTIQLTAITNLTSSSSLTLQTKTSTAAPEPPSITATVVDVTSITIQWDPLPCQHRNGHFIHYRVMYFPAFGPVNSDFVSENEKMYTLRRLPPRTSYEIFVQALNVATQAFSISVNLTVSTSAPSDVVFLLNGQLYPNNSVVTVTDIGTSSFMSALSCLTPSLECCSDSETPNENSTSVVREWYLPDGTPVSSAETVFSIEQVSSAVSLHRSGGTSPTGVFRCEIPDASGNSQNIYVGIYPEGVGSPSITSVIFDRNSTILICISTGGPPTTVRLRKDGVLVNTSLYQQSKRLVDAESATYLNTLVTDNVTDFASTFTCEVSNSRHSFQETVELNGVSIARDPFILGQSATASCTSDTPATRLEWLSEGEVVANALSTQTLPLLFSLVNDSIHEQVYVCRVTRGGGMVVTQNFTVQVIVPSNAVQVSIERSGIARAGEMYSITCNVSTVSGLMNSPNVSWTVDGRPIDTTRRSGITISFSDSYASSILTFNPLRSSHGAMYTCVGVVDLDSPLSLHSPQTTSMRERVTVQISTPEISISVPPGPLYAGTRSHTFICTISLNAATDVWVEVDFTWLRRSRQLASVRTSSRYVSRLHANGWIFFCHLTLSSRLNIEDTSLTIRAVARPYFYSFAAASEVVKQTVSVPVELPPVPSVFITSAGPSTGGLTHSLICSSTVIPDLSFGPTLSWQGPGVNKAGVKLTFTRGVSSGLLSLSFSSLLTSYGGVYTCTSRLYIRRTGVDVSGTNMTTVVVQIPPRSDLMNITGSPLNDGFFKGLDLTFTCMITLDVSVNTPIIVQGSWIRNGTDLTDNGNQFTIMSIPMTHPPYSTSIRINPLSISDTGTYTCVATITPLHATFVTGTSSTVSRDVTPGDFPVQTVDRISVEGSSIAGVAGYNLICNTSKNQFLSPLAILAVQWLNVNDNVIKEGHADVTVSDIGPTTNSVLTSKLTFNCLYTSQAGEYKCRSLLTIPGTVDNHAVDETFTVAVTFPGVVQNLVCAQSSSPSNLSFSWELPVLLGEKVVGYQVTVNRLEHRVNTRELTQFQVSDYFTDTKGSSVTGLDAEVPYSIAVKAISLGRCGQEKQIICFTQEGVPPPPENVVVVRFDSTSIGVSWTKFTLVELKGLANYIVSYNIIIGSRKRQTELRGTTTVNWTENQVIISGLQPGAEYDVTVRTSTAAGSSAPVGPLMEAVPSANSDKTVAIISGVVSATVLIALIIAVAATVIIVIALILRNQKAGPKPNKRLRDYVEPEGVMLHNLSLAREVCDTTEADHEYEILDQYNQAYEDVKIPPLKYEPANVQLQKPLSSTGDYDYTQCPAYVSVATAGIHGNQDALTTVNNPATTEQHDHAKWQIKSKIT